MDNVTHVTVGEKITRGTRTGTRSLKVHVTTKRDVAGAGRIPKTMTAKDAKGRKHQFITDVIEVGRSPELFGMRAGNQIIAFDRDLGLAGLTFSKGDRRYVLTNAHVVCDVANGRVSGTAGWYLSPDPTRPLGPVVRATHLTPDRPTNSDAAAIEVANPALLELFKVTGTDIEIASMGMMRSFASPIYLASMGSFLACVEAEPVLGDNEVEVDGVVLEYRDFWQVRNVDRKARRGLSGGVLLRNTGSGFEACGLVFGGIPDEYLWAFPFRRLFERLYASLPA